MRRPSGQIVRGFTLVELLVVIGIIALLIAILLPSLAAARRAAQRTACAVKLQQMLVAAQVHAADHKGYYPLAGVMGDVTPAGLGDSSQSHYDYFKFSGLVGADNVLVPITFALAKEMSYRNITDAGDNASIAKIENDPNGMIKNFLCPSQASSPGDIHAPVLPLLYWGTYTIAGQVGSSAGTIYDQEAQSYIFNEQVLGYDDAFGRLRGKASAVRQSSKTMFACDGLGTVVANNRSTSYYGSSGFVTATLYSNFPNAPVTMGDAISGRKVGGMLLAGDPACFDLIRHRGKINVAFCDGHVETRDVSYKDLLGIYLTSP